MAGPSNGFYSEDDGKLFRFEIDEHGKKGNSTKIHHEKGKKKFSKISLKKSKIFKISKFQKF